MIRAPWARTRFEKRWNRPTMRSSWRLSWGEFHCESGETLDEPPNMVSAIPPLAFASW